MPTVSEEELQQLREQNQELRERIASAQSRKAENEAELKREFEATQLVAENVRLEAELNAAEESAKVDASREGTANLMEQAKAQLEKAQTVAEQTVGTVDTNVENPPKDTTGATSATEKPSVPAPTTSYTSSNGGN